MSNTSYCPKCGSKLNDNYCPCGYRKKQINLIFIPIAVVIIGIALAISLITKSNPAEESAKPTPNALSTYVESFTSYKTLRGAELYIMNNDELFPAKDYLSVAPHINSLSFEQLLKTNYAVKPGLFALDGNIISVDYDRYVYNKQALDITKLTVSYNNTKNYAILTSINKLYTLKKGDKIHVVFLPYAFSLNYGYGIVSYLQEE